MERSDREGPFVAAVCRVAVVDSSARVHTIAVAVDGRAVAEEVAWEVRAGAMELVLPQAARVRPSRAVASRATRILITLLGVVVVSSTTERT